MKTTATPRVVGTLSRSCRAAGRMLGKVVYTGVVAALVVIVSSPAHAAPQGGVVVGGEASISNSPGVTTIDQASRRAIINWREFNIDKGELTRFNQPGQDAIALNRVTGKDPSSILGQLNANGQVWLVNQNGVFIGRDAQIDVHGLLATTADIADQDFLASRFNFNIPSPDPNAEVINQGTISIGEHGLAGLVAPHVRNDGVIRGRLGQVVIAGAPTFTVDFYGDGLVQFATTSKVTSVQDAKTALASNSGTISVEGGDVLITADAAAGIVDEVINMSGVVEAQSFTMEQGVVVLDGGDSGTVVLTGEIDASGDLAGAVGGTVKVLGDQVALLDDSEIDVSGHSGGGKALIGGYRRGEGPDPTASRTEVASRASISADALVEGDGGEIVVWSELSTAVHGKLTARGGATSGNGGFIETSGRISFDLTSTPNASATNGNAGTWLIDPTNIVISSVGDGDLDSNVVDSDLISDVLSGGTNVTLDTSVPEGGTEEGFIVQDGGDQIGEIRPADIANTSDSEVTLRLNANTDITLNASITSENGPLNIILNSDSDETDGGSITLNSEVRISSNGGDVIMGGGGDPLNRRAVGNLKQVGGTLLQMDGILVNGAKIDSGAGLISLRGRGDTTRGGNGIAIRANTVLASTSGAIKLDGVGGVGGKGDVGSDGIFMNTVGEEELAITTTGGGITLIGVGGEGSFDFNRGIDLRGNVAISSSERGTITFNGTGGTGNTGNIGILMNADVDENLSVTTTTGNIALVGIGGQGDGDVNRGIGLQGNTTISSSDGGTITLNGTGGGGDAGNGGIFINADVDENLSVTTTTGNIALVGIGGQGDGDFNRGLGLQGNTTISSSEGGAITLNGTGGTGDAENHGIYMNADADQILSVTATTGNIALVGIGGDGDGGFNRGIRTLGEVTISSSEGGAIALNGTGGTGDAVNSGITMDSVATISSFSAVGSGGTISLVSGSDITAGNLVFGSGDPTQPSGSLTVSATDIADLSAGLAPNGADTIIGSADLRPSSVILPSAIDTQGGDFSLFVTNGLSFPSNLATDNGNITLDSLGAVTLANSITAGEGNVLIRAGENIEVLPVLIDDDVGGLFDPVAIATTGGDVTIEGADIVSGALEGFNGQLAVSTQGGAIDVTSRTGGIADALALTADSSADTGIGGQVEITAAGPISTGVISASGEGGGGSISVTSTAGSVTSSDVDSSSDLGDGGQIQIAANDDIFTGSISSSGGQDGGSLTLNSTNGAISAGDIQTSAVSGQGGDVDLFATSDISTGAISSTGPLGGGDITLNSANGAITTDFATEGALNPIDASATDGPGGSVTLEAGGEIEIGGVNSFSLNGPGGAIELSSGPDMTAGNLVFGSSDPIQPSGSLTVSATDIVDLSAGLGPNGADTIIGTEDKRPSSVLLPSAVDTEGGAFSLFVTDGLTFPSNLATDNGDITLDSLGSVTLANSIAAGEGNVLIRAGENIEVLPVFTGDDEGNPFSPVAITTSGGEVTVEGADILSGALDGFNGQLAVSTQGGAIDVMSRAGGISDALALTADSSTDAGAGGAIDITAQGDLFVDDTTAFGQGGGGNITLTSVDGALTAADIDADGLPSDGSRGIGGQIAISATGPVSTGVVSSSGEDGGGSISVVSSGGTVTSSAINSSSDVGDGGQVQIAANGTIFTGTISSSGGNNGNTVNLTSTSGAIATGDIQTTAVGGQGGAIDLSAISDISTGAISSTGPLGGGDITLNSANGAIATEFGTEGPPLNAIDSSATNGPGGSVTLEAGGEIEIGGVNSFSTNGPGGAIVLSAGSDITAPVVVFGSANPSQVSGPLTVDTPGVASLRSELTPNGADIIAGRVQRPANFTLPPTVTTGGGAFTLLVAKDYFFPTSLSTDGGAVTFDSLGSITLSNTLSAGKGNVILNAAGNLSINGGLTGQFADFKAGGTIAQSGSAIDADTLLIQAGQGIDVATSGLRQLAGRALDGDIRIVNSGSENTTITGLSNLITDAKVESLEGVEGLTAERGAVQFQTDGRLILGAPVSGRNSPSSGEEYSILLVTNQAFENNVGENALDPGNDRYLVYSIDPIEDERNMPESDFDERFEFPFNSEDPDGSGNDLPSIGNFFLYTVEGPSTGLAVPLVLPPTILPTSDPEQLSVPSDSDEIRENVIERVTEPVVTVPEFQPQFAVPKVKTFGQISNLLFSNDGNHELWGR